jgi:hypothetical protein
VERCLASSVVPRLRDYEGQVARPRREALARLKPRVSPRALVSCPINNMAFAVGQLAVFQGANDEHI